MRDFPYGALQIHKASNPIRTLWYSKDEEPEPVERYQLCDREWQDPAAHERAIDRRLLVCALMDRLDDRRRDILVMHYVDEMTLEEIGQLYGITRERVRQIERDAIRRVKYWAREPSRLDEVLRNFKEQLKEQMQ